jgi:pimeloyl-ACP methyl ester carboxylesterase
MTITAMPAEIKKKIMKNFTINIPRVKISTEIAAYVRDTGRDIIFFIHGLGCTKESFVDAWNSQRLEEYAIITPDLPGFGNSPEHSEFSYRLEDHAEICRLLLEQYPGKKVHLVGHSMGGAIALLLIDLAPGRIVSFTNVEGNLFNTDCSISRSVVTSPSFESFKQTLFNRLKYYDILKTDRGTRLWAEWIEKSAPDAFNRSAESLVRWTDSGMLLEKFKNLKCKKTYFCGEKNSRRKVLDLISGIQIVSISGSGHFPMNDNPNEFYYKLSRFIKETK